MRHQWPDATFELCGVRPCVLSNLASSNKILRKSDNPLQSYGQNVSKLNMASVRSVKFKTFEFWSQYFRYCPNLLLLTKFHRHDDISLIWQRKWRSSTILIFPNNFENFHIGPPSDCASLYKILRKSDNPLRRYGQNEAVQYGVNLPS